MKPVTEPKTQRKASVTKKAPKRKGSDLSKIFGVAKGQIFYDESIFNFGKRKVTV